ATFGYDKGSVWNTYLEAEYRLPERLRGVQTICFVFRRKVHIKGFVFARPDRAFSRLDAAAADSIYGDSFRLAGTTVEDIGNNVSIQFRGLDFGAAGADRVQICWRS